MRRLLIAPHELLTGPDALEALALRLAERLGPGAGTRLLLVHGERGYAAARERIDGALAVAGLAPARVEHRGPCSPAAIDALVDSARAAGAAWLLGVGGGRVIDSAKAAAQALGLPFAVLPTSPATCAATAPTVVVYDAKGRHLEAREGGAGAALVALDARLLAAAPDRLLAAGVADAWAKVHEVTLTTAGRPPGVTTGAALALVAQLRALLERDAVAALRSGPGGAAAAELLDARQRVAEAVVALPGLIGGLAGADAKLALAHPLHDALTAVPGAHAALHGEKVAFGTLVQLFLAGDGCDGGGADARADAFETEVARYAALGIRCDLEGLGCSAARAPSGLDAVAANAFEDPAVGAALPRLTRPELRSAIEEVDQRLRRHAGLA